ncbi:MAG: ABC transporter substrate-binding protein, partial [Candidatus Dormibacteraceae bacterium]
MNRRDVLRWGAYAGIGFGTLDFLAACGSGGGSSGGGPKTPENQKVSIVYVGPQDPSGTVQKQVDAWNSANPKTHVELQPGPANSADLHTQLLASFTAKSSTPDIIDADVIWPGEFASAQWIRPLDGLVSSAFKKQLFDSAIKVGMYQGKLYALQRYYDSGQIYYRTDLLQKYGVQVPQTIDELVAGAKKIQAGERSAGNQNFWGFYWIGAQIEAIVDEFFEWYWSYGGDLTGKGGKIEFNNDAGRQAVQLMYDTIYTDQISPPGTPTYKTTDIVPFMQNGNTAFMRNWEFAWVLVNTPSQSKVAGKVALTPIPGKGKLGYGCTGGWCMAISAFSKYPDRAAQFLEFMLGEKEQKFMAINNSLSPVRPDVLNDAQVKQAQAIFKYLPTILKHVKARPQLKNYTAISAAMQPELSAIVTKQK